LANNACCTFEGVLPEGQEIKNEVQDATSNNVNRLKTEVTPVSFRPVIKTFRSRNFFPTVRISL